LGVVGLGVVGLGVVGLGVVGLGVVGLGVVGLGVVGLGIVVYVVSAYPFCAGFASIYFPVHSNATSRKARPATLVQAMIPTRQITTTALIIAAYVNIIGVTLIYHCGDLLDSHREIYVCREASHFVGQAAMSHHSLHHSHMARIIRMSPWYLLFGCRLLCCPVHIQSYYSMQAHSSVGWKRTALWGGSARLCRVEAYSSVG